MILAHENIDHFLIDSIRKAGIEVCSVYENNRGITDEEVIALSRNPPRIILTEDKDFGEWVFAHHLQEVSILFIRYHFKDTNQMIAILIDFIFKNGNQMQGSFTTITIDKIRTRRIGSL